MAAIITRLQRNLDDKKQKLTAWKNDLQERVDIVDKLEKSLLNVVSGSGSTAQERRNKKTLNLEESLLQHREQISHIEDKIAEIEREIADYERQKREWEEEHG